MLRGCGHKAVRGWSDHPPWLEKSAQRRNLRSKEGTDNSNIHPLNYVYLNVYYFSVIFNLLHYVSYSRAKKKLAIGTSFVWFRVATLLIAQLIKHIAKCIVVTYKHKLLACSINHNHLIVCNKIFIFLLRFSFCFVSVLIVLRQKLIECVKHLLMYPFNCKSLNSASQKNFLTIKKMPNHSKEISFF